MRLPQLPAQFDVGGKCRRLFGPNGDLKVLSVVVSAVFIVLVHQQVVAQLHERHPVDFLSCIDGCDPHAPVAVHRTVVVGHGGLVVDLNYFAIYDHLL